MSERKFNCPLCGQKISCEATMAGVQIQCPACQKEITIPRPVVAVQVPLRPAADQRPTEPGSSGVSTGTALAPQPPAETRLSVAKHEAAPPPQPVADPASTPGHQRPPSPVPMNTRALEAAAEGSRKQKRLLTIVALVIVLGVGAYFGIPAVMSSDEEAPPAKGRGGKFTELVPVMDTPDPAGSGSVGGREPSSGSETEKLPVWTLDLKSALISRERAKGMIGGKAFAVEAARLDPVGQMHLLTLRQGGNTYADREILVYLRLKPGETLEGKTWSIDPALRIGIPQILKRWVVDPKLPPQSKPFASGYAMKLEFGRSQEGALPGKIFVALPDAEKTVVSGEFSARLAAANPIPLPAVNRE